VGSSALVYWGGIGGSWEGGEKSTQYAGWRAGGVNVVAREKGGGRRRERKINQVAGEIREISA